MPSLPIILLGNNKMKSTFVQYLLIVVATILVAGCATVYKSKEARLRNASFSSKTYTEKQLAEQEKIYKSTEVRLRYAAINGNTNTVKQLLAKHGDIDVNTKDENGNTALMHAAASSKVIIAKLLLGAGADVHKKNKERNTALIIAVWHGQVNMVEALINAGADVNVKNRNGNTALMLATANERKEIVRLLAAAGAVDKLDRTALMLPHSMMTTLP